MRAIIARALRRLDVFLLAQIIPVSHFGFELLCGERDGFTVPNRTWRRHWGEREVKRFYQHNRQLMSWAARLRSVAAQLEWRG